MKINSIKLKKSLGILLLIFSWIIILSSTLLYLFIYEKDYFYDLFKFVRPQDFFDWLLFLCLLIFPICVIIIQEKYLSLYNRNKMILLFIYSLVFIIGVIIVINRRFYIDEKIVSFIIDNNVVNTSKENDAKGDNIIYSELKQNKMEIYFIEVNRPCWRFSNLKRKIIEDYNRKWSPINKRLQDGKYARFIKRNSIVLDKRLVDSETGLEGMQFIMISEISWVGWNKYKVCVGIGESWGHSSCTYYLGIQDGEVIIKDIEQGPIS